MYEDGDHLRWEIYVKSRMACEDQSWAILLRKVIFWDYFDFDTSDFHRSNIEIHGVFLAYIISENSKLTR